MQYLGDRVSPTPWKGHTDAEIGTRSPFGYGLTKRGLALVKKGRRYQIIDSGTGGRQYRTVGLTIDEVNDALPGLEKCAPWRVS
jgi:hypothetical protein